MIRSQRRVAPAGSVRQADNCDESEIKNINKSRCGAIGDVAEAPPVAEEARHKEWP